MSKLLNETERRENNERLRVLFVEIKGKVSYVYSANDLSGVEAYEQLKKMPAKAQKELILQLNDFIVDLALKATNTGTKSSYNNKGITYYEKPIILVLQSGLLRKKLNYSETEWIQLFRSFKATENKLASLEDCYFSFDAFPLNYAIKQIEHYFKKNTPTENLTSFIKEMITWKAFEGAGSDLAKAANKLKGLLLVVGEVSTFSLKTNDIGDDVNQIIASVKAKQEDFHQIFYLASKVSGSKPSKKFSDAVMKLQDKIGLPSFVKIAHRILDIAANRAPYDKSQTYHYGENVYLCGPSQQFIKGIVWTLERYSDKETIRTLSRLCEKSYTKVPGKGPAAAALGNACVYILGNMRGKDGLGALSRLKLKVKQNNVKKTIDKHLLDGAKKYNVSVEELKEMAVPAYHLEKGTKTIAFDDYSLKIFIEGRKVHQQWMKPNGKTMKSVPSIVKNSTSLANKLKTIRKEVKEIQKVYSAQKQRIDNQFILDRTWDLSAFQKYYLQHGLVYPITEKLIWTFIKGDQSVDAILVDNQWQTIDNESIDWMDAATFVKLWHPINATEETIVKWREKIIDLERKQPIKQAFREIYLLTDAEINTRTYSNRMAAHILKQHQFSSLANLRDWKYSLMGAYDDGVYSEICQKYLPEYNMTAEYWIDQIHQEDSFNEAGIWLYIATDQIKFKDANDQVMDLINVPKTVFTEIMRDVDLFVGVASVGNDPQWMDNNGERQANRDYWTSYSFGDLTEIAKTRKTILERLLPRLKKIRDKARIEGKFLIVTGKRRTYKIHIGSGNILMEPNDQYLCIVPSRSAENSTDKVFIPFEGDRGLSIVLSKAFLLAEDDKITDVTILSQIN